MLQVVAHSIAIYVLIYLLGRRSSTPVFLYSFAFLLAQHLYAVLYKYKSWDLDISTVLMMYTLKYTALGCQLSDGLNEQPQGLSVYRETHKIT